MVAYGYFQAITFLENKRKSDNQKKGGNTYEGK